MINFESAAFLFLFFSFPPLALLSSSPINTRDMGGGALFNEHRLDTSLATVPLGTSAPSLTAPVWYPEHLVLLSHHKFLQKLSIMPFFPISLPQSHSRKCWHSLLLHLPALEILQMPVWGESRGESADKSHVFASHHIAVQITDIPPDVSSCHTSL